MYMGNQALKNRGGMWWVRQDGVWSPDRSLGWVMETAPHQTRIIQRIIHFQSSPELSTYWKSRIPVYISEWWWLLMLVSSMNQWPWLRPRDIIESIISNNNLPSSHVFAHKECARFLMQKTPMLLKVKLTQIVSALWKIMVLLSSRGRWNLQKVVETRGMNEHIHTNKNWEQNASAILRCWQNKAEVIKN